MARPRSDIEPRLIRAARERFLRDGVDGASLREIAREAGTNIGMLYYYFPAKDDLFLAVVEEVYAGLLRDLRAAAAPELPWEERVAGLYGRLGALSDDEFTVLRLVVREAMISSQRLGRVIARFREGHIGMLLELLAEGYAKARVREDIPPGALLPFLAGSALGLVLARRLHEAVSEGSADPPFVPAAPREVAAVAAGILQRGLAPAAAVVPRVESEAAAGKRSRASARSKSPGRAKAGRSA
jgi:AcrR family transcriptional regulator